MPWQAWVYAKRVWAHSARARCRGFHRQAAKVAGSRVGLMFAVGFAVGFAVEWEAELAIAWKVYGEDRGWPDSAALLSVPPPPPLFRHPAHHSTANLESENPALWPPQCQHQWLLWERSREWRVRGALVADVSEPHARRLWSATANDCLMSAFARNRRSTARKAGREQAVVRVGACSR